MSGAGSRGAGPDGPSGALVPGDFRIGFSDEGLEWAGESRPGLPILHWPDGSVCEPVLLYFGYSAEVARVVTSSMRVEACAIREFLCFLSRRGRRWDEPTDRLIRDWREEQRLAARRAAAPVGVPVDGGATSAIRRRRKERAPSSAQVERKIAMVVDFYRLVPEAICLGDDHRPFPRFVGPCGLNAGYPITTKRVTSVTPFGPCVTNRWVGAERGVSGSTRRPTPRGEGVARVLTTLRGRASARPTARPTRTAGEQSRMAADRGWLMARCQAEAGLRCEEVSGLSLGALAEALVGEGLLAPSGRSHPDSGSLLAAWCDQAARGRILSGLEALAADDRREIGVGVTCKGRRRKAPFPVRLLIDLLEIGVWTVREAQVRNWSARKPGHVAPLTVFLSFKTGLALGPGSVGDIIKDAFADAGVDGSGHRLRAYFGNELARRLLLDRLAINGFVYDSSVEKWVLERVADAMGHAKTSTTVAHYVEQALMRVTGSAPATVLAGVTKVQRTLVERGKSLREDDFVRIGALIDRLSRDRLEDGPSAHRVA